MEQGRKGEGRLPDAAWARAVAAVKRPSPAAGRFWGSGKAAGWAAAAGRPVDAAAEAGEG